MLPGFHCCDLYFTDVHACFPWQVQSCIQGCDLKRIQVNSIGWSLLVCLSHSDSVLFVCISCRLAFLLFLIPIAPILVHKRDLWLEGAKRTEPDCSQWCPVTGGETVGTIWNTGGFLWTSRNALSLWRESDSGTGCQNGLWSFQIWGQPTLRGALHLLIATLRRTRVGLDTSQRSLPNLSSFVIVSFLKCLPRQMKDDGFFSS